MKGDSLFGMKLHGITAAASILALLFAGSALRAQTINMQYVPVGNPGNAPDPATGSQYGSVGYAYRIGTYDVTDSQYCAFLNAVDPTGANSLALYSPQGDGEYGITFNSNAVKGAKYSVIAGYANMPVVDVDYWDCLRSANYLDDGMTENGAYTLTGGNTDGYGTPGNAPALLANPQHNAGATVWLPSENEWYKAAYYDPELNGGAGGYWSYATQSNTAPGRVVGSGSNEANYYSGGYLEPGPNYLTATGTFSGSMSYYGTYDQSGDVSNWQATTVISQCPVVRGGNWDSTYWNYMSSSNRYYNSPSDDLRDLGFRVAGIPEPRKYTMFLNTTGTDATLPEGTGCATLTRANRENVAIAGKLPDGESFSISGTLAGTAFVINKPLIYPSAGKYKGLLSGTLAFATERGASDFSGSLIWNKPQQSAGKYQPAFNTTLNVTGSLYVCAKKDSALPGFPIAGGTTCGTLVLSDTNGFVLSGTSQLSDVNKLVLTSPQRKLTISIAPSTGIFRGSFMYPGNKPKLTDFSGVLFQDQTIGGGFFLGPNGSGTVLLSP